ncbi:MFS transporter [Rubellimicrobium aerolatum]|uniref:MFS transporter n=1 Tax=Rubellimicrobium aerolatum TaxID=490979 RepID=A0ABW0SC88_9RHOB|nr:MFS transporter [Rubellimicrobium aerolatum]MBP1806280.1 MFS family permease [Rubellimicrobium aerolatum]
MTHTLSSDGPAPARPLAMLALMTAVQIAGTASILALTALAPEAAATLGVGSHWIGYQISLIYFAGMFASAIAGSVVGWLQAERVIALELGLFGLGLWGVALGSFPALILASGALGVAYGLNNPASSELLSREGRRANVSLVFSIKQSGVPLGAVVANMALPALALHLGASWQLAVAGFAVLPLGLMLLSLRMLPWTPPRPRPGARALWAAVLAEQRAIGRSRPLATLAALGGLYSALQLIVTAFAVVSLVDQGWSLIAAGGVGAALQLAGAAGRIGWGIVGDRIGGFRTLGLIGALAGAFSLALGWGPRLPDAVEVAVMIGLGGVAVGWNGVFLALTARNAPGGRVGANTGAILVYTFLGVILGPSIFALAYQVTGSYAACFALFSTLGFLGAALSWACLAQDPPRS